MPSCDPGAGIGAAGEVGGVRIPSPGAGLELNAVRFGWRWDWIAARRFSPRNPQGAPSSFKSLWNTNVHQISHSQKLHFNPGAAFYFPRSGACGCSEPPLFFSPSLITFFILFCFCKLSRLPQNTSGVKLAQIRKEDKNNNKKSHAKVTFTQINKQRGEAVSASLIYFLVQNSEWTRAKGRNWAQSPFISLCCAASSWI